MKKITALALIAMSLSSLANAQQRLVRSVKTGTRLSAKEGYVAKGTGTVSGVFYPASFGSGSACASSIYTYRDSTFGYFAGNNTYGDEELLMRYSLSTNSAALPATVDTVLAYFGAKYQGGNGMVYAKVYAADGTGAPAALLGTSTGISVSNLDTVGNVTSFAFASPVALTTNQFFVSIDVSALYTTGDTVGIFSTDGTCATTDQTAAWTKESDDNFYAFSDQSNNWGFAPDLAIFAKVTAHSLSVGSINTNSIAATAYPAPATNQFNVSFTGQDNGLTSVTLKDLTGRTVSANSVATTKGLAYKVPFDVSALSNGMYFVELSSGTGRGVLKVSVKN